jgi:hypothetical protein
VTRQLLNRLHLTGPVTVIEDDGRIWQRGQGEEWQETDSNPWPKADRPRVLVFTPAHPTYGVKPQTLESIQAAVYAYGGGDSAGPVDWLVSSGDNPCALPYENVTYQHNKGRSLALTGGYDALLSIEADMVVPADTIERLLDTNADIAYGLYVWRSHDRNFPERRHRWHRWSAYTELTLWGGTSVSLDHTGADCRAAWGKVIDVAGVGMGCTLIRRRVLERMAFRLYDGRPDDWLIEANAEQMAKHGINPHRPRHSMLCNDWFLALDAQHHGFSQRCDLGVVCGHITDDGVLWPDPDAPHFYRLS